MREDVIDRLRTDADELAADNFRPGSAIKLSIGKPSSRRRVSLASFQDRRNLLAMVTTNGVLMADAEPDGVERG